MIMNTTKRTPSSLIYAFSLGSILASSLLRFCFFPENNESFEPPSTIENTAKHDSKEHCMFVVSKLFGTPSDNRRDASFRWYREATLASIKKAAAKSEPHGIFAAAVLQASDSFQELGKDLDEGDSVIVEDSIQAVDKRVNGMIKSNQCKVVTFLRLDGDDILTPTSFDNVLRGWELQCAGNVSDACILHTGPYRLPIVYLQPYATGSNHVVCGFVEYEAANLNAMSQGLGVSFPVEIWQNQYGGTSRVVFLDQHVHVWRNLLNRTRYEGHTLMNNPVVNHGVWVLTSLSSHFYHDVGNVKEMHCTLDSLEKRLGLGVGEILWNARNAVPNLTKEEWAQNKFVKMDQNRE